MAINLGFQTKYILNPWSILFHPIKVPLKVFSILFKIHSACCGLPKSNASSKRRFLNGFCSNWNFDKMQKKVWLEKAQELTFQSYLKSGNLLKKSIFFSFLQKNSLHVWSNFSNFFKNKIYSLEQILIWTEWGKISMQVKSRFSIFPCTPWNYSAANFCFNKGLCMIWNKGTLSEHE